MQLGFTTDPKEAVTWIVFSESDTDYGYTKKELEKYKQQAQKNGINMIVVDDADDIVKYINTLIPQHFSLTIFISS